MTEGPSQSPCKTLLRKMEIELIELAKQTFRGGHGPSDFVLVCLSLENPEYLPLGDYLNEHHGFDYCSQDDGPSLLLGALASSEAKLIFETLIPKTIGQLDDMENSEHFRILILEQDSSALFIVEIKDITSLN